MLAVRLHVAGDHRGIGAQLHGQVHGHGGVHPEPARLITAGGHHAPPAAAAHDQGLSLQLGLLFTLHRHKKGVQIEMNDVPVHGHNILRIVVLNTNNSSKSNNSDCLDLQPFAQEEPPQAPIDHEFRIVRYFLFSKIAPGHFLVKPGIK